MTLAMKKRILFDSVIVTGANIFDNVVFFVVSAMAARYLSIENYGEYTTAIGFATFFIAFCDIGLNQSFIRAVSMNPEKLSLVAGSMIILKTLLSVVTFSALCGGLWVSGYSRSMIVLTMLFGVVRLCSDYLKTFFDFYDANRRFIISALFKSAFSFSLLAVTILAVKSDSGLYSLFSYRLGAALVMTAVVFLSVASFSRRFPVFSFSHTISFLKLSIPFGVSTALSNGYQRVGIIFLSLIQGTAVSGLYSNALLFFTSFMFIPGSISRVLLPQLYRVDRRDDIGKFQYALDVYGKYLAIGGFYIALMMFLFGGSVLTLFFGDKYEGSVPMLKMISLAIPFIFTIADTVMIALDRQRDKVKIETVSLILMISLNLILIPGFGGTGAIAAAGITYISLFAGYHLYLKLKLGFSIAGVLAVNAKLFSGTALAVLLLYPFVDKFGIISGGLISSFVYAVFVLLFVLNREDLVSIYRLLVRDESGKYIQEEVSKL
jgi:O-antigen/teichoic acid export membrane protein